MVEDLKNHESGQANESPMLSLADEKTFEEHMATGINKEKNNEDNSSLTNTAIESIANKLSLNKDELKNALLGDGPQDIIKQAQDIINDNYDCAGEIADLHCEKLERSRDLFVFDVLSDMHDQWCREHSNDFFNREQFDNRYKFLDFSLIGESNAYHYFDIAEPILAKLGIEEDPEDHNLFDSYYDIPHEKGDDWRLRDEYMVEEDDEWEIGRGCYFAEDLYENPSTYLSKGSSEKIAEAIKNSFNTAAEITMQVGEHGSGDVEADWGCLWAYHYRGGEGVDDYWFHDYNPFAENDAYFNSQEYINDGWD